MCIMDESFFYSRLIIDTGGSPGPHFAVGQPCGRGSCYLQLLLCASCWAKEGRSDVVNQGGCDAEMVLRLKPLTFGLLSTCHVHFHDVLFPFLNPVYRFIGPRANRMHN